MHHHRSYIRRPVEDKQNTNRPIRRKYNMRPSPLLHSILGRVSKVGMPLRTATPTGIIDYRCWLPWVRDQGTEGSCTGQATSGWEDVFFGLCNKEIIPEKRSAAYLYARTRIAEGTFPRDSGACMADEFAVLQSFGVCGEQDMPYDDSNPGEPVPNIADADAASFRCGQPATVDLSDVAKVHAVLASGMPIGIAIPVYESFENTGSDGMVAVPDTSKEAMLGGHGLLILGADFDKKVFIVANSWGVNWGDKGFCYIPFAYTPLVWEAWTAIKS